MMSSEGAARPVGLEVTSEGGAPPRTVGRGRKEVSVWRGSGTTMSLMILSVFVWSAVGRPEGRLGDRGGAAWSPRFEQAPTFRGYDCYEEGPEAGDPAVFSAPNDCSDDQGRPYYGPGDEYILEEWDLLQVAETHVVKGHLCRLRISKLQLRCSMLSHSEIVSVPHTMESQKVSIRECRDWVENRAYVDHRSGVSHNLQLGENVMRVLSRGHLMADGGKITCYGETGRVDGRDLLQIVEMTQIDLSLVETLVKRQVQAPHHMLVTRGRQAGTEIRVDQVSPSGGIRLGDEAMILDAGWDQPGCPLSLIRHRVKMRKFPPPAAGRSSKAERARRRLEEQHLKPRLTNLSSSVHPEDWVLLVEVDDQFAVNIGQIYQASELCGKRNYFRTNHFHVVAAQVSATVQSIQYMKFDPELVYEADSLGRMDLLAFHVQRRLDRMAGGVRQNLCLTKPQDVAGVLSTWQNRSGGAKTRVVSSGELVFALRCPRLSYQAVGPPAGCPPWWPVRRKGDESAPTQFLQPLRRWVYNRGPHQDCENTQLASAYRAENGSFFSWRGEELVWLPDPPVWQGREVLGLGEEDDLQLHDTGRIYTNQEAEQALWNHDFSMFVTTTQEEFSSHHDSEAAQASGPSGGPAWIHLGADLQGVTEVKGLLARVTQGIGLYFWEHILAVGALGGLGFLISRLIKCCFGCCDMMMGEKYDAPPTILGKVCMSCCSQQREARRRETRARRAEDYLLRRVERRWGLQGRPEEAGAEQEPLGGEAPARG